MGPHRDYSFVRLILMEPHIFGQKFLQKTVLVLPYSNSNQLPNAIL